MPANTTLRSPRRLVLLLGILAATVATTTLVTRQRAASAAVTMSEPLVVFADDSVDASAVRDRDIVFWQRRADADRESASDRAMLGSLLFSRARATGSATDLERAEAIARESIALRDVRNGQAFELLATILMARHAFVEAHEIAVRADSVAPGTPSHLALLGEIELELGDYDAAAAHFKSVQFDGQQFTIGARIARWYELTGQAEVARAMLQRSITQANRRDDLSREQVAWFHYRLGELELRLGRHAAADSAFQRGLVRHPDDVRILSGLARCALARGDARQAVSYAERTIGLQLDPTMLGTLSDAWSVLGDTAQAVQYTRATAVAALTQPGAIHRAWGLHLLDHGTAADRADVLRRAQQDIRIRRDVYGYDLLAWALYRAGRTDAARDAMRMAMAHGTQDVMLAAHATTLLPSGTSAITAAPATDSLSPRRL